MPANAYCPRIVTLSIAVLTACLLALSLAAPAEAGPRRGRFHHAVTVALHQKGDPYRYGAEGPRRFDCSGLTQFSYARAGLALPRSSDAQARYARRVRRSKMRRGDLIFFHRRGNVYHVGIYRGRSRAGNRLMVHAPSPGRRVRTSLLWSNRWFAGTLRRR
jgi:cell wall-associated NlpC family hydrolase